jgi:hypothetical protein
MANDKRQKVLKKTHAKTQRFDQRIDAFGRARLPNSVTVVAKGKCAPDYRYVRPEKPPSRCRAIYPRLGTFHGVTTLIGRNAKCFGKAMGGSGA